MKFWTTFTVFLMASYAFADVQPPFQIGDLKIDENFRQIYLDVNTLQNNQKIVSTWTVDSCVNGITIFSTGTIAANTTITISSNSLGMSYICGAVCGELEQGGTNTTGLSTRVKSFAELPVSFTVFNADASNSKSFTCSIYAKP